MPADLNRTEALARRSGPGRRALPRLRLDPRLLELTLYQAAADLRSEAAKTYVNYLWWVIDPILGMLVFYVVFGLLFERGGEGFVVFLLTGLVFWNWYRQSITHAGNAILNGKGLMNQVAVPKLMFPAVCLLTDLTKFAVVFLILLGFLWLSGYGPGVSYLALPVLLVVQLLLIASLGLVLAGLVPFLPDLRFVVDNLLYLQFFLSGVFFSVQDLPAQYHLWFHLNPMAVLLEDFRAVLLEGSWPHWGRLALITLGAGLLLAAAARWIGHHDRDYPRVVA
jgi:lipopolysaccharide transport system permease protein